jgi:hypothetical protein
MLRPTEGLAAHKGRLLDNTWAWCQPDHIWRQLRVNVVTTYSLACIRYTSYKSLLEALDPLAQRGGGR